LSEFTAVMREEKLTDIELHVAKVRLP